MQMACQMICETGVVHSITHFLEVAKMWTDEEMQVIQSAFDGEALDIFLATNGIDDIEDEAERADARQLAMHSIKQSMFIAG